jgi:uncharacterized protein with PIN domain
MSPHSVPQSPGQSASRSASPGPRFIVDANVGKLARWLRMMGYDASLFLGEDDGRMIETAQIEGRLILTRDTMVTQRRIVALGQVKAILLTRDDPEEQLRQVVNDLGLEWRHAPFSICLEDNHPLEHRTREQVEISVPASVFRTQTQYMQCPACGRIYWRGTHWRAMEKRLESMSNSRP